ncbi:MAG TPA: amidohydrolase family protein [Caulobacteraceae bacterium]|jgi:N-acyl-D-aspartate/D-glutamate deacylase
MRRRFFRAGLLPAALAALAASGGCASPPPPALTADTLLVGGWIHDGSGGAPYAGDVAIRGERIVFVGDAARAGVTAARRIDARGLIVAPGFIDPHTHSGSDLASDDAGARAVLNHLTQGVTTVFIGNDGDGEPDVAARHAAMQARGVGANVGSFVGFGAVRRAVVGEAARAPSPDELARMKSLVAGAMCQGAVGFSAGLYYAPQSFAKTDEVVALAREAGPRGGLYDTHLRDESSDNIGLLAAVDEALEIGRRAGLPVHIAHIKAQGVDVHGRSGDVIARIEAERAAGRRVTADQYPWRASGTRVSNALVPRWMMDGGMPATRTRLADASLRPRLLPEMADNLRRRGGPESLLITSGRHTGKTLGAVATAWNVEPVEAAIRIVRDEGDARVASFNMTDADIRNFAARPWVVSSSDATSGHPRRFGTFPLAWRKFVREEGVLTPAQFVRRSTGQTADIFGLKERGYLREGAFADVVAFDPTAFAPRADFQNPTLLSEGVRWLLVNGSVAIEAGVPTRALAGKALAKSLPPGAECAR